MPSLFVRIHYGPDKSFNILKYKPQRLYGLREHLIRLGYRVKFFEVPYENYCMIEICGTEVFRCNITNLKFSTLHGRDEVAQRAAAAVIDASNALTLARTFVWSRTYLEYISFNRGPYNPKNYLPVEEDEYPTFESCRDCVKCCDILVTPKTNLALEESKL